MNGENREKKLGHGASALKSFGYTNPVCDKGKEFGKDRKAPHVKLSELGASRYRVCGDSHPIHWTSDRDGIKYFEPVTAWLDLDHVSHDSYKHLPFT